MIITFTVDALGIDLRILLFKNNVVFQLEIVLLNYDIGLHRDLETISEFI